MSAPELKDRRSRRDRLGRLGVLLVLSGIVVIVMAAIMTVFVVPVGAFLVVSGIGLVVASEYGDEADVDYSRWRGLEVRVRRDAAESEDVPAALVRSHLPTRESTSVRRVSGGCRLAQALTRRRDGR